MDSFLCTGDIAWSGKIGNINLNDDVNFKLLGLDLKLRFRHISLGDHALAISTDGKIYSWGNNYRGKLAINNDEQNVYTPTLTVADETIKFKTCSAGTYHSVAITEEGKLYSWGEDNHKCVLGYTPDASYDINQITSPRSSSSASLPLINDALKMSKDDSVLIGKSIKATTDSPNKAGAPIVPPLNKLPSQADSITSPSTADQTSGGRKKATSVSVTSPYKAGVAATTDNLFDVRKSGLPGTPRSSNASVLSPRRPSLSLSVVSDGTNKNENGQTLAQILWDIPLHQLCPRLIISVPTTVKFRSVSCGEYHTLALTESGKIFSWGFGQGGRLGHNNEDNQQTPKQVNTAIESLTFCQVSAGSSHSLALDDAGRLWSWGNGYDGRLGVGGGGSVLSPLPITMCKTSQGIKKIKEINHFIGISAGWCHSLALNADGIIFSFGRGREGQLGHGDKQNKFIPTAVTIENQPTKFGYISAGRFHSLALTSSGSVYTFGRTSPRTINLKPALMRGTEGNPAIYVEAGWDCSLALMGPLGPAGIPGHYAPSSSNSAPGKMLKIHFFGGQSAKVLFDPELTVRTVLEKIGSKLSGFSIDKYIAKDLAGNELKLDSKLGDIKTYEITFKTPKLSGASTNMKKFTVYLPNDQKNAIIYKADLILRDVLDKMCSNRGIKMALYIPKDMNGKVLDMNSTLGEIGSDQITFNTKQGPQDLKILLPNNLVHTIRYNPDMLLAEALSKCCEHRGNLSVHKYIPKSMDGRILDPALPIGKLELGNQRQVAFTEIRASKYSKEQDITTKAVRKAGQDLKEFLPKTSHSKSSEQISLAITTAYEKVTAAISAQFPNHEVITKQDGDVNNVNPTLNTNKPTWLIHLAGKENYVNGIPICAFCVSYLTEGKTRLSVIYNFMSDEFFYAEENAGAYLNDTGYLLGSLQSSTILKKMMISSYITINLAPNGLDMTVKLASKVGNLRTFGCPELEMCFVTKGTLDSSCVFGATIWHTAAASLIANETKNVKLIDIDAKDGSFTLGMSKNIIVGQPKTAEKLEKIVSGQDAGLSDANESDQSSPTAQNPLTRADSSEKKIGSRTPDGPSSVGSDLVLTSVESEDELEPIDEED